MISSFSNDAVFFFLIAANFPPFMGLFNFWNRKNSQGLSPVNTVARLWCRFWPKGYERAVTYEPAHYCGGISIIRVVSQFRAIFSYCFTQTAHDFEVIFLIDLTTFWQELTWHNAILIEENSEQWVKPLHMSTLGGTFSILAFLAVSIGVIWLWFRRH